MCEYLHIMFFVQSPTAKFDQSCEVDIRNDNSPEDPSKEQAERHSDILKLAFRSGIKSNQRAE